MKLNRQKKGMMKSKEEEIIRFFAKACHPPKKPSELSFHAILDSLHIDSLSFVDVLMELEKIFPIHFNDDDFLLQNYRTIGDVAKKIKEKMKER